MFRAQCSECHVLFWADAIWEVGEPQWARQDAILLKLTRVE